MAKLFPKLDQYGGIATSQQGAVTLSNFYAGATAGNGYQRRGGTTYGGASAGSVSTTVVAPATNSNGLILRTLSVDAVAGHFALFADTAAPSSVSDTTKNKLLHVLNGTYLVTPQFPHLYLPAGLGLYFYAGAAGVNFWCSYDLQ